MTGRGPTSTNAGRFVLDGDGHGTRGVVAGNIVGSQVVGNGAIIHNVNYGQEYNKTPDSTTGQVPSRQERTATSAEQSACVSINGIAIDWSGRGTSHVDFSRTEQLPLTVGRFLGYGVNGGVHETECNGIALAWKRKFCRTKIGKRELKEMEIIKRLDHHHIVRLVGTYTQGPFLGLLLWPVAVCDLANLMEDVDWSLQIEQRKDPSSTDLSLSEEEAERVCRLAALGCWRPPLSGAHQRAVHYLEQSMGCMASAVAYLHEQGIKHKDLKPSNILLSPDGPWLTDFGTATDFSVLTQSVTDDGERGTPRYFAPEVASFNPSGRAADIFSLGCIFFEMITLILGYTLEEMKVVRPANDKSFQSNLDTITSWFRTARIASSFTADQYFMGLVRRMLAPDPAVRPTAKVVEEEIALIDGFIFLEMRRRHYCRHCCSLSRFSSSDDLKEPTKKIPMELTIGNTYEFQDKSDGKKHAYTFFIRPSLPDLIQEVHIFKHQSFRNPHSVISQPPFEYRSRSWAAWDVGVYVVLRPGFYWSHSAAWPVPRSTQKRMLPLLWELSFKDDGKSREYSVIVCEKLSPASRDG